MPEHKIKLLVFIPSLECGGSEKYVSLLCNNINTGKFAVTLVVLNNNNPFYTISNPLITVINLKVQQVRHSFFKIRQLVKRVKPDIIYTNANHLNLFFALFKNLLAPKITIVARESSIVSINSRSAKLPVIYNWLIRHFYKRLHCIICQSAYMQQDLVAHYGIEKNKTVIINNAVETVTLINNQPQKNKFITVARLSKEKGIDRLIHAMANLSVPFKYHIIGDGDQKQELLQLIATLKLEDKIFWEGEKSAPFKGMEDASFFLMGSHYEGFPNTLLEAGANGIPVIAFDAPGGINEIINNKQNGLLVHNNDIKAFAFAIEKAMAINFNRQQIKEDTERKFSVSRMTKITEELFIQFNTDNKEK